MNDAPNMCLQWTGGPQPVGPPYAGLKILEHTGLSGQPLKLAFDAARRPRRPGSRIGVETGQIQTRQDKRLTDDSLSDHEEFSLTSEAAGYLKESASAF